MAALTVASTTSEAAIFSRLWDGDSRLTPELARHILDLKFGRADVARMHLLAERNREGSLTPAELEEFDNFIRVGDLLAVLQSKARQKLKASPKRRATHD